jgi:hypothetical protein
MTNEEKLNQIIKADLGWTRDQYVEKYPGFSSEDYDKLTNKGEANEPSRKSIFGTTKADK